MKQDTIIDPDPIASDCEKLKAEYAAMKEREMQYRQLLDNLQTPLYTTDIEGRMNYYNKAAADLWGREPQIGKDFWCGSVKAYTMQGELIPLDQAPMSECVKKGYAIIGHELVIERPDKSRKTIIPYPAPLYSADGKLSGAVNVLIDITDRKHTETVLQKTELHYHQLVESLQTAIYTTDAEGHIILYNQAALNLWGREPKKGKDRWCGSHKIYDAHGAEIPLDNCPMAVCLKEGRAVLGEEILIVRPDGSLRNVAPHPQPIFDERGKVIGGVNMLLDITEKKRSEQALLETEKKLRQLTATLERKIEERTEDLKRKNEELKKSEERYHKMVEEVEDYAIVLLDKEGIIQNWNKGAEKIKGYRENEIVGKSFKMFYTEEDRKKNLPDTLLKEAREKGKAIHEGWRLRKDGTCFWGSIVITALHDAEHNIVGFSKVTRDLTERKKGEDKLMAYTKQLEFQNKELEQFAYAASHDMKEPLRKINFYNNFVVENAALNLDERSREYLNRSINSVKKMSQLIEDLLTYSRASSAIDNFEETDLNEMVEEISFSHKDVFENEVTIDIEKLPVIKAVPFQFKQLLDNLINNSIKYKHPNRKSIIKITSKQVNGEEIKSKEADLQMPYHKISIIDNGIGFQTLYADKIFEIFQRLPNQSGYKGSGIGLALCKKIVQNHHGFIEAEGQENQGARFDIYVPAE